MLMITFRTIDVLIKSDMLTKEKISHMFTKGEDPTLLQLFRSTACCDKRGGGSISFNKNQCT